MNRYFPELVAPLAAALPGRCVVDGTPAYDADILVGDVITAVDGVSVSSSRALGDLLRERRREGQTHDSILRGPAGPCQ